MAKGRGKRIAWAGLPAAALFVCSSCIIVHSGNTITARHEREVELAAPLAAGSSFSAETGDGSIKIRGVETGECAVLAKIVAHAGTEEQAQELAQQIEVRLEPSGTGLKVVIDRPRTVRNAWYAVSLDVQVPVETRLVLETDDGSVHVTNITGDLEARTSDGSIEAETIKGDVRLRTADGGITCGQIEAGTLEAHTDDGGVKITDASAKSCTARTSDGNIVLEDVRADSIAASTNDGAIRCQRVAADRADCRTDDGSIYIEYRADAPKAPHLTATTSSGGITFLAPPGLSAAIEASTDDGSIRSSLPITVAGKIGKSLSGTIGGGEGRVHLRTEDGSITIR
jgi:DUF4097 and DUF4098 domain-containing protein YvlB